MEYLILFAALLFIGLLVFAKGLWDAGRQRRYLEEEVRKSFGLPSRRKYEDGETEGIPRYFEKHKDGFFLDDITWNDLNLDMLFLRMNVALSSAGQEYLYYMLRTPCFDREELAERERMIRDLTREEEVRLQLQMLYLDAGRTGKYSLYDYLDFLDQLGERSSLRQIGTDLLFLPAVGLIAFAPPLGIVAVVTLMSFNIATYLKQRKIIDPYLTSFRYVFRCIRLAERLTAVKADFLEKEKEKLRVLLGRFQGLKRSAAFGMHRPGNSGSPLDLILDYLNMMFHFDIMGFNRMLKQMRIHAGQVDELLTITGRLEALIAVASFRQSLENWCEPELDSGETAPAGILMEGLYHPMLANPVKNAIEADRGVLVTGSNASGKSTFLKAVAINAILAQTVHTCCADRYRAGFVRVMTSMALRDDLESGESYYIVEIRSLKRILDAAAQDGPGVLCFVDEVLRGTNTVERIAASTQILRSLNRPNVCCFAATHDIELTELLKEEYDNYHFEEEIEDGDIRFPYLLLHGKATTRNAIRLLAIMGYDESIIRAAERMASRFAESGRWEEAPGGGSDANRNTTTI